MISSSEKVPTEYKEMDALFRAIGFIVVQWGQAEQSLDLLVAALFQNYDCKHLAKDKKIPFMLAPKLRFVRKCMTDLPELSSFRNDALALVSLFEKLSKKRHDLIHGAVSSLSPRNNTFHFIKLDIKENEHHARDVQLTASDFPLLAENLVSLGKDAVDLAKKVWEQSIKIRL